jgi:hypothetical protein
MVLRAGFLKKVTYFELMICDKYRGKITGPQCVTIYEGSRPALGSTLPST